jgi:single-stranded DNA-binding protein
MNSCVLMAKIIRSPELRYTQDNQLATTQMLVEFHTPNPSDTPCTLRVVGWGNLATEIKDNYKEGDQVILVGRLSMNRIDRPEGFKETRAEFVASHVYRSDASMSFSSPSTMSDEVASIDDYKSPEPPREPAPVATIEDDSSEKNLDDIPF